MSLTIAGAGPGNIELLTKEVLYAVKTADIVVGFERIADDIRQVRSDVVKLKTITETLALPLKNKEVLILASGDPCFFGITEFLKSKNVQIDKVLSGISSMQYFMNKLQKQWQHLSFYSFHGRKPDFSQIKNEKEFFILTDKINTPNFISKELKNEGVVGKLYIGYNLSYEDELIEIYNIGDSIAVKSSLNTVLIERF